MVVVAHPDDEVIWFSSVLASAERVIVCFGPVRSAPAMKSGREDALKQLPLNSLLSLNLQESEVFGGADWTNPKLSDHGIQVRQRPDSMCGFSSAEYERNFSRLLEHLRPLLSGVDLVYTHSPWGEYGHEEHIQVHRAVARLSAELEFSVHFPSLLGPRSANLAGAYLAVGNIRLAGTFRSDVSLAQTCMAIYSRHGVWTWMDDYVWPDFENFLTFANNGDDHGEAFSFPLSFIGISVPRSKSFGFFRYLIFRMSRIAQRAFQFSRRSILPHN